jgi:hypothetical protein
VKFLRNQAVTQATNAVDIDVGCCRGSRTALKFEASCPARECEGQGLGVG